MRVRSNVAHHHRARKIVKMASGFRGRRKNLRVARIAVNHALMDSFKDRRRKKRDMRGLWIIRMNAALRECGLSYSRFTAMMKKAGVILNRKVLANIAAREPEVFKKIVEAVK
jgi:large subunit ribosomal protein L20